MEKDRASYYNFFFEIHVGFFFSQNFVFMHLIHI